ncbi:MAG TPA: hypothetical protein VN903_22410 [Polyangia bacterium]|jgi:hypothetical protein|nr:hypothetical protein [Polyangia bacterium]
METLLVLGGLFVVALIAQLVSGHEKTTMARLRLTEVPETAIAAIKDGTRVRIKGRLVAREALRTSPISYNECIGFRLTVDVHVGAGEDDDVEKAWKTVVEEDDVPTFVVADETGEAVLHGPFELILAPFQDGGNDLPTAVREALVRANVSREGFFGWDKHFRWFETILVPGDEIVAIGHATMEIDPARRSPSHRDPPVSCHLRASEKPLILADPIVVAAAEAKRT